MRPLQLFILACLSLVAVAPLRAEPDADLRQLLAESARAPLTGFERTIRRLNREGDAPTLLVDRFVPTSANAGTWTLLSVDGRRPTAAESASHRKDDLVAVVPGFHRLHIVLGKAPTSRVDSGTRSIFRWESLPKGAVVTPGGDLSASLSGEAVVDHVGGRATISQVRLFSAKPFTIRAIARMNSFEVVSHYRPGPDGRPLLVSQTSLSDVKAPFGIGGRRHRSFEFRPL